MENCTDIKQKHMEINRNKKENNTELKRNYRYILIDLSAYNMQSIANALLGYGIYLLFSSIDLGFESMITVNAFKYLNRM
jgi:type III secretory pathway component EscR